MDTQDSDSDSCSSYGLNEDSEGESTKGKTEAMERDVLRRNAWVQKNRAYFDFSSSILLLCYGDHNLDPFMNFVTSIKPDGHNGRLLFDIIADVVRVDNPKYKNLKMDLWKFTLLFEKGKITISDPDWKDNIRLVYNRVCIRTTIGGISYIIANGYSRHDYRMIDEILWEKKKIPDWKINHSVLCTHYLKSYNKRIDKSIFETDVTELLEKGVIWAPGGAHDFLAVSLVTPDQEENFYNSLSW